MDDYPQVLHRMSKIENDEKVGNEWISQKNHPLKSSSRHLLIRFKFVLRSS